MIKGIKLTSEYKDWSRMFCSKESNDITLNFTDGVNVIAAPNGTGKTTLLKAMESLALDPKTEGVHVNAKTPKKGRENVFFFSVKELDPKKQLDDVNPMTGMDGETIALWFNKLGLSHGQTTQDLIKDITEIAKNGTAGLVIIDEPELALDSENIFNLIQSLKKLDKKTQFIIVSHHPWIVLNKDFNVIDLNPTVNSQELALKQMQKLNLLG